MGTTSTLNLRRLSILILAAAAVVSMSAGAAKAQWHVNVVFRNFSNAVVYDLRIVPSYANRFNSPNVLGGLEVYPRQNVQVQVGVPQSVAPCGFYVIVFDRNGIVRQGEVDLCIGGWTLDYYG